VATLQRDRETVLRRDRLHREEINRLQGKLSVVSQHFTSLEVRARGLAALCALHCILYCCRATNAHISDETW